MQTNEKQLYFYGRTFNGGKRHYEHRMYCPLE